MTVLRIEATATQDPDAALDAIADLASYPELSESIEHIDVSRQDDGTMVSEWEVEFRGGLMTWTQRDVLDRDARTLRFEQIEGDSERWEGGWATRPDDAGCRVEFEADFELGIPSLNEQLTPIATRALYDVIGEIIRGTLGPEARVLSPPPSA
jgi:ribosome-associated toxin RatA of RatAB toxin-antitoxin module